MKESWNFICFENSYYLSDSRFSLPGEFQQINEVACFDYLAGYTAIINILNLMNTETCVTHACRVENRE